MISLPYNFNPTRHYAVQASGKSHLIYMLYIMYMTNYSQAFKRYPVYIAMITLRKVATGVILFICLPIVEN